MAITVKHWVFSKLKQSSEAKTPKICVEIKADHGSYCTGHSKQCSKWYIGILSLFELVKFPINSFFLPALIVDSNQRN